MTTARVLLQYKHMKKLQLPKLRRPKLRVHTINYKKLAIRISVLAVVLLVGAGYMAYTRLYLTKERRFWKAIENSMSTQSFVREVTAGGTGNRTVERTRLNFGAQASMDKISSVSAKSATSESNVTTRSIMTPGAQYISYTNIFTTETKPSGEPYDFSSINGVWAVQAEGKTPEELDRLKLEYVQQQVSVVPFGNLNAATRRSILQELKSAGVYEIDYSNIVKQEVDGKEYMAYPLRVKLRQYVTILQKHFDAMGFGLFPSLDPSQYAENSRYNATLLLDLKSTTLRGISSSNQSEIYTNYGVSQKAPIPAETISLDELQSKLQALQQ